jgi:DNA-binding MarR family transcriptional regulator
MAEKMRRSRPGKDPIIFHIHRLSRSIMRASMAQYTRLFGLGVPQVQILNSLGVHGTLASKDIASYTQMNKALVSRSLSELTALGYTKTSADAGDARRSLWRLTKKGADFVAAYRAVGSERRARLLKVLTPQEQTLLAQFIGKLYASSEELGSEEAAAHRKNRSAGAKLKPQHGGSHYFGKATKIRVAAKGRKLSGKLQNTTASIRRRASASSRNPAQAFS